jgi:hypothetical protein
MPTLPKPTTLSLEDQPKTNSAWVAFFAEGLRLHAVLVAKQEGQNDRNELELSPCQKREVAE